MTTQNDELREELATLQHQQWSGWMKYLFSKCQLRLEEGKGLPLPRDGDMIIPAAYAQNLNRLILSPYSELTEKEKELDRIEADKYLLIIKHREAAAREESKHELAVVKAAYGASKEAIATLNEEANTPTI